MLIIGTQTFASSENYENQSSSFTNNELQGEWRNVPWPDFIKKSFGFSDKVNDTRYQSIFFVENMYLFFASEEQYINIDEVKTFNYNDYKLNNSDPNNQWIELFSYPKWVYLGVTKITKKTSIKKVIKGEIVIDFQLGDMILTYYNKDSEIVFRKQFRKVSN